MTDIVSTETRSRMMSGIRAKNTRPEMLVRQLLHRNGLRFRLHRKDLPGSPDIVMPKYKTAIFVNGCFWHGHDNCSLFKLPATRPEFWQEKIGKNRDRDSRNYAGLLASGWKILVIWECAILKRQKLAEADLLVSVCSAIKGDARFFEISGNPEFA